MNSEKRFDCPEFDLKNADYQVGNCQTDGHFLCSNCRHIVCFHDMELSDNRERYYPKDERIKNLTELLQEMEDYLSDNHAAGNKHAGAINSIHSTSIFHQQIKDILRK